jgi:hypothetical protein
MGIRSILKKLANDANDGDSQPPRRIPPIVPPLIDQDTVMQGQGEQQEDDINQQKLTPAPLRMGETSPGSGVVDAARITEEESIQDKINRVKSGQMTEEEKRAFLATALSAGMTPVSRKPLITPKRMESTSASPFPTDSILRNFISGKVKQHKKDVSLSSISIDLNTDAQKKEYLEMVTNPDRFTRRIKPKSNISAASLATPTPPIQTPTPSWSQQQPQQPNSNNSGGLDDLGARLGVYAMEEEVRRRESEKQRARERQEQEERERILIIQKQEAEQRASEVARRQQMALKQVEEQARRQEIEAEQMRKEDEKAAEQERLAALVKQQEAYWTERLAKEREAKAKRERAAFVEATQQKEQTFEYPVNNNVQLTSTDISTWQEPKVDVYSPYHQDAFNPNEMDLLDEVRQTFLKVIFC